MIEQLPRKRAALSAFVVALFVLASSGRLRPSGDGEGRIGHTGEPPAPRRSLRSFPAAFGDPRSVQSRVPATTAKRCPEYVANDSIPRNLFKSQSMEDQKLLQWFQSICDGTYIEMGALDGERYSNSYVFNAALGWKGVLIELAENNYMKLVRKRPNELATIHAGVCDQAKTLHHVGKGPTSGIWEFTTPSFRDMYWQFAAEYPRDPHDPESLDWERTPHRPIECDTLDALLLKNAPEQTFFDFYSLDVEGAELSVLHSIDFERVQFGVVLIEADEHNEFKNQAIKQFMGKMGYAFQFEWERSYWFVNVNFHDIYHHLIY